MKEGSGAGPKYAMAAEEGRGLWPRLISEYRGTYHYMRLVAFDRNFFFSRARELILLHLRHNISFLYRCEDVYNGLSEWKSKLFVRLRETVDWVSCCESCHFSLLCKL